MSQTKREQHLETIAQVVARSRREGVVHQVTEDERLTGRTLHVQGRELINFGSCSYLGLEQHEALKKAICETAQRYGSQFSSSRAYLSIGLYEELESLLEELFQAPVIVAPSTTLGHLSALPVLIGPEDAVILDHQVHASVSMAAQLLRAQGAHVELIRHSHMGMLESRLKKLSQKHKKIWYLADGLYSMYGDFAPLNELEELLSRYEQLHLYMDDAHGMSWTGVRGTGSVAPVLGGHPRVYIAASLNKSFAAAGGVLVFPDQKSRQRVRDCGGTLIFSGPIQPPMLGAAIASARIHLYDDIQARQDLLMRRIQLFNRLTEEENLPVFTHSDSPIGFISVGEPDVGFNMSRRLVERGFYLNLAAYPSVPYKKAGLRITLHNHLKMSDIMALVRAIAEELPVALKEEEADIKDIYRAFRMPQAS